MSFEANKLGRGSSSANNDGPITWQYSSDVDAGAAIALSAYFDGAVDKLNQYDEILSVGTDGPARLQVSSAAGVTPVTVAVI